MLISIISVFIFGQEFSITLGTNKQSIWACGSLKVQQKYPLKFPVVLKP